MGIETPAKLTVSLLQTWPVRADTGGGGDAPVDFSVSETPAAAQMLQKAQASLIAGNLRIELDQEAGRFVQTLTDPTTHQVLMRFPYESQLAYSRAITAYMNAKADSS